MNRKYVLVFLISLLGTMNLLAMNNSDGTLLSEISALECECEALWAQANSYDETLVSMRKKKDALTCAANSAKEALNWHEKELNKSQTRFSKSETSLSAAEDEKKRLAAELETNASDMQKVVDNRALFNKLYDEKTRLKESLSACNNKIISRSLKWKSAKDEVECFATAIERKREVWQSAHDEMVDYDGKYQSFLSQTLAVGQQYEEKKAEYEIAKARRDAAQALVVGCQDI